jgi:hypothetical protein
MSKHSQAGLIKGTANHRRTEGDYMGTLIEAVTLADWREVVEGALQAAKGGDAQARNWLAQYLIGRPDAKAPSPLNIVVQQLSGTDPLVERLAAPHLSSANMFADILGDSRLDAEVLARVEAELKGKV